MGYYDDLKSDKWELKRVEILERDEFKCQKCFIGRPVLRGLSNTFGILTFSEMILKEHAQLNGKNLPSNFEELKFVHNGRPLPTKFIGDSNEEFLLSNLRFGLVYYKAKIFGSILQRQKAIVCFYPELFSMEKRADLNVHHKYYIQDRKPWEYDNDALITLCVKCHQKEHETSDVFVYSEKGGEKYKTTVCDKCGGSGYLHEYDYYHNGICFQCGGEGSILVDKNNIIEDNSDNLPF